MHVQIQKSAVSGQKAAGGLSAFQRFSISAFAGLLLISGCSKSPDQQRSTNNPQPSVPTPLAPDSVLRVHWAGKQKLGVAASSYSLMRLWNLREGRMLEMDLLAKLSSAPWQRPANEPPAANNASTTLRPILNDILNEECCLEIREDAGSQQLVFAIRLADKLAAQWHRDLATVVSSLEGTYPTKRAGGWFMNSPKTKTTYELERAGEWVVFGAAKGTNSLFQEIVQRIGTGQSPFTITVADHWLAADADLNWVKSEVGGQRSEVGGKLPRLSLVVTGNGAETVTTGDLTFSAPLNMNLAPWKFPTAQMQEPLIQFGAARGLGPWLPDQIFTWADARTPLQMHFAAVDGRANEFAKLAESFIPKGNAWLTDHGVGTLGKSSSANGIIWKDLPMIAPYLTATSDSLLTGGLVPSPKAGTNVPVDIYPRPSLDELIADISSRTNLVAYEWETTGSRAESIHVVGQILRFATRHPQMPANTASSEWLNAARNRLGNTKTMITLTAPNRLSFQRTSSTGFNVVELHLLADWMESPMFPRGSYTGLSPIGPAPTPAK